MKRILCGAAALVLAGCGPAAGAFRPSSVGATPGPAEVSRAPLLSVRQQVLQQYRRFQAEFENALATDDVTGIAAVATGEMAAQLTEAVQDQQRQGIVRRGHTAIDPRVELLPDGEALVVDCVISSGLWAYDQRTGAAVGPPPEPVHTAFRAVLRQEAGIWKVAATAIPEEAAC